MNIELLINESESANIYLSELRFMLNMYNLKYKENHHFYSHGNECFYLRNFPILKIDDKYYNYDTALDKLKHLK